MYVQVAWVVCRGQAPSRVLNTVIVKRECGTVLGVMLYRSWNRPNNISFCCFVVSSMQKLKHEVVCIRVQGRGCVVWSVGLQFFGFRVSCFTFSFGVLSSSRTYQFLKIGYEIQAVMTGEGTCSGDSCSHARKPYTPPRRSYSPRHPASGRSDPFKNPLYSPLQTRPNPERTSAPPPAMEGGLVQPDHPA